jgi:uncharacterized protein (TIGR02145 family)
MLKKLSNYFFVCILGILASCAYTPKAPYVEKNSATGTFIDERDSTSYKTVTIGSQIWMAENLKYNANGSYCYDNDPSKCKYGRLYSWSSARDEQLCPDGWHLPFFEEWEILSDAVGGKELAGRKLRSNIGWGEGFDGNDNYEFTVRPSGYRYKNGYEGLYKQAYFWLNGNFTLHRKLPFANGKYIDEDIYGRKISEEQEARGALIFSRQDAEVKSKLWRVNDIQIDVNGRKYEPNEEYASDYWFSVRCISNNQSITESEDE